MRVPLFQLFKHDVNNYILIELNNFCFKAYLFYKSMHFITPFHGLY